MEDGQTQVRASSDAYRQELAELRERGASTMGRVEELRAEKRRLFAEVARVEAKLTEAEAVARENQLNERRLEDNMRHFSEELRDWLSTQGRREEFFMEENRAIASISGVAQVVENEVAAHAAAAVGAARECEDWPNLTMALGAACVRGEHRRMRVLRGLLGGALRYLGDLDARCAIEGDNGLNEMKLVVSKAVACAFRAQSEAARLAAEAKGGDGVGASVEVALHEEVASFEARYRELEVQLRACLTRLQARHDALLSTALSPRAEDVALTALVVTGSSACTKDHDPTIADEDAE